jgi:biopolymer transport protein ExbD
LARHRRATWASSLGKLSRAALSSDINVTPLVDVCLVLLIIFMVVLPLLQKGVPVNLPITARLEKAPETDRQLHVSVKDDGSVYIGPVAVREELVESELKSVFDKTPDRQIAVKGDRRVLYGKVLKVLRACREVGFNDVGLISQPEKSGRGGS